MHILSVLLKVAETQKRLNFIVLILAFYHDTNCYDGAPPMLFIFIWYGGTFKIEGESSIPRIYR